MDVNDGEPLNWTACIRFWVVGGWTLIFVGGLLMALSTVIL